MRSEAVWSPGTRGAEAPVGRADGGPKKAIPDAGLVEVAPLAPLRKEDFYLGERGDLAMEKPIVLESFFSGRKFSFLKGVRGLTDFDPMFQPMKA